MTKREEKIIYKAYKQFYNREPDFSEDNFMNLTVEIQTMVYVLDGYGVLLGANGFRYEYKDLNMPMSMDIQDIIVGKLIDNVDDLNDTSLQFSKRANKMISITGNAMRSITDNSQNRIEELRKICNILYVKKSVCPSASDDVLMEIAKCTEEDLKKVEQLIELIKQEESKDNFDKANIENVRKMINGEAETPYGMFINESGNGKLPEITETSRKKLAKALIK